MNSFYDSIAGYCNNQNAIASANSTVNTKLPGIGVDAAAPLVQAVQPPLQWNWPVVSTGQIPVQQFQFCDSIPQDPNSSFYTASARSFSIGYSGFLSVIKPNSFPLASALQQNIANNSLPVNGLPGSGWVQVLNNAGQLEWKKMWDISQSPANWAAAAGTGLLGDEVTFSFTDPGMTIITNSGQEIPAGQQLYANINSSSVGRIQVTPGNWYNSSIVTIAQSSSNYLSIPPEIVFGDNGLINCRITEFLVALKPAPVISFDREVFNAMNITEDGITSINLAGFTYTNQNTNPKAGYSLVKNAVFDVSSKRPGIVDLQASINGANADNVFIIAVILEVNSTSATNI